MAQDFIPIYGEGRLAMRNFTSGDYVLGIYHSVMAGLDVCAGVAALKVLKGGAKAVNAAVKAGKAGAKHSDDLIKAAQKLYPNKAGKVELHHIVPKYLGGEKNGTLVPLDAAYHQVITNEFRNYYPYGRGPLNETEMLKLIKDVYSKFPLPPGY